MRNNKIIKKCFDIIRIGLWCVSVFALLTGWLFFTWIKLPEKINIRQGEVEEFDFAIPAIAQITQHEQAIGALDLSKPVTLYATDTDVYKMSVKLFGVINFKETEVSVINDIEVKPVGKPVGIYVKTKGILVLQSGEFIGEDGFTKQPAALLQEGDYSVAEKNKKRRRGYQ